MQRENHRLNRLNLRIASLGVFPAQSTSSSLDEQDEGYQTRGRAEEQERVETGAKGTLGKWMIGKT